ncbi:MAG: hypothetical protein AAGA50_23590 [Pseudomonadota bacterium]
MTRLLWLERLKSVLIVGAVGLVLLLLFIFEIERRSELAKAEYEEVTGTLLHHTRRQDDEGSHTAILTIRLEDGQDITIKARKPSIPAVGSQIRLIKKQTKSGRVTYRLDFFQVKTGAASGS